MTQQITKVKEAAKETIEQAEEQIKKYAMLIRAELGLPIKDEERGILIQPGRIEERTRVKNIQVIVHTYLRTLAQVTGFKIYEYMVDEMDHYLISLDGLGRAEYIQDRQPKVVQPMPSATTVNVQPQDKEGKKEQK